MYLYCPACLMTVPGEHVNIRLGIGKCPGCATVFQVADQLPGPPKPKVGLPSVFLIENWGPELVITRRWYFHGVWALLAFCTFWDGFLVMWYTAAVQGILRGNAGSAWPMLLFPVLHLGIGIGLTYFVVSSFVNKTTIQATASEVSVRHGPLPWPGNCQVLTAEIKQLFCTENHHKGRRNCRTSYDVQVLKHDNTRVKLLGGLTEVDQALFIEQQIEEHLKIRDEHVVGEVRV